MAANRLWDIAYRVHERELRWLDRLPQLLAARTDWPVADTIGVDVGASVGVYTRSLIRWCAQVHAVEPNARLRSALTQIAGNVSVHTAAAGRAAGEAHLTDIRAEGGRRPLARLGEPSAAAWSAPCSVLRLDALMPEQPAAWLAKIDTEGTEADVITGLGARLNDRYAILLVEIEAHNNPDHASVFEHLAARGFRPCRVAFGRLRAASPGDVLRHARGPGGRLGALWPWSNNYIFLRPDLARALGVTGL